jgi:ankyrin repeat protein
MELKFLRTLRFFNMLLCLGLAGALFVACKPRLPFPYERQIDRELIAAAADGDVTQVESLLGKGANIEARALDDWTALTIAASNGQEETVKILLKRGAQVNAVSGGEHTPLFWAERGGHHNVAKLLRDWGGINE